MAALVPGSQATLGLAGSFGGVGGTSAVCALAGLIVALSASELAHSRMSLAFSMSQTPVSGGSPRVRSSVSRSGSEASRIRHPAHSGGSARVSEVTFTAITTQY